MPEAQAFDPLSEQLLAEARARETRVLSRAERITYWSSSAAFVAAALALLLVAHGEPLPKTWMVGLLVLSYAVASRLEFEVGSTLAVATQLVLVEMVFVPPPSQLPLWVAAGGLLGQLPEYALGVVPVERMLVVVGSSWFAFGPALVFTLFPADASLDGRTLSLLALALAAQFAIDLLSSTVRESDRAPSASTPAALATPARLRDRPDAGAPRAAGGACGTGTTRKPSCCRSRSCSWSPSRHASVSDASTRRSSCRAPTEGPPSSSET